LPDVYKKMA